jgi:hypothetical protein
MAENSEPSLTFGVEMEVLYVHELSDFQQLTGIPIPTGPFQRVSSFQRRMYIASDTEYPLTVDNSYEYRDNIAVADNYQSDYTQWLVTNDLSLRASPNEICLSLHISADEVSKRFQWDQIELVSPTFHFSEEQTWLPQLRQIQNDLGSRTHLGMSFCNDSCGLHVHFAVENSSQYPLPIDSPSSPPAFPLRVLQHLIILWA